MFALDYFKLLLFFPLHLIFYLLLLTSTLSVAIFLTFPTVTLIMFYKMESFLLALPKLSVVQMSINRSFDNPLLPFPFLERDLLTHLPRP